jgi:hypothetical protein
LKFLLNLQNGHPVRRLNWTMTINPRLDTSPENYDKWGVDRATVTPENVGDKVHLRVELQGLWRLPRSNAILFSIRGYLIKMRELVTVPKWARRFPRVLRSLPPELVDYKGITRYQQTTLDWLAKYDDGAPTNPGVWPDDFPGARTPVPVRTRAAGACRFPAPGGGRWHPADRRRAAGVAVRELSAGGVLRRFPRAAGGGGVRRPADRQAVAAVDQRRADGGVLPARRTRDQTRVRRW